MIAMIPAKEFDGELWVKASDHNQALKDAVQLAVQQEREACAKVADEWAVGWPHPSKVIAEHIRVRGNP